MGVSVDPDSSIASDRVCCARRYGETHAVPMPSPWVASHAPKARACSAPVSDSGTSASRSSIAMMSRPWSSALVAATLPMLSP